jgi:hypothetical protein
VATEKVVVEATAFLRRLRPNNLLPSQSSFFPVIVQLFVLRAGGGPRARQGSSSSVLFVFDYGRLTD